jgi:hypothetical protein
MPNFHSYAVNPFVRQRVGANSVGTAQPSGTAGPITVIAGDGLIMIAGFASGNAQNTALTCSDTQTQSWTTLVSENQFVNSNQAQYSAICYVPVSVGGVDSFTVTATSAAQGLINMEIYEVTPALTIAGAETQDFCSNGQLGNCIASGVGFACPFKWNIPFSNASLVISDIGGSASGTDNQAVVLGTVSVDQTNSLAGNITQIISEGSTLSYCINHATGSYNTGVMAAFGPFNIVATNTITGFLVPNFVNGQNNFSWLYFLIVVMVPMGEIIGVVTIDRNSVLDRHAIIFIFLGLLLLDSIFGVMLNVVTVAMPFIFGILFGIYLWRGRG